MKTLTLFEAYKESVRWQKYYSARRKEGQWGIAVDTDEYALKWQRYDRLATKLGKEITKRLSRD